MTQASFSESTTDKGQQTPGQFDDPSKQGDSPTDPGTSTLSEEQLQEILKRDEHAQKHIQTLEQEAKERAQRIQELEERYQQLEADLEKRESFESALEKIQNQQQTPPTAADQTTVDPDDVTERVLSRIQQKEQERIQAENKSKAIAAAQERYGEKFLEAVSSRAESLGMTLQDVDQLAATKPQVFNELFVGKAGKPPVKQPGVSGQTVVENKDNGLEAQRELYRSNKKEFFGKANFDFHREQLRSKE